MRRCFKEGKRDGESVENSVERREQQKRRDRTVQMEAANGEKRRTCTGGIKG